MEFLKKYTKMIITGVGFFIAYIFWLIFESKLSDTITKWFDSLGFTGRFMEEALQHIVSIIIFIIGYIVVYIIGRSDAKKEGRAELETKEKALIEREKIKDEKIEEFERERDGRLKILETCLKIDIKNEQTRYFTWRGRSPIHMISGEGSINPLNNFETFLTNAILSNAMQPRWQPNRDIRSDCVYEITDDGRSKHKVSGGPNNMSGLQVLVVVPNGY